MGLRLFSRLYVGFSDKGYGLEIGEVRAFGAAHAFWTDAGNIAACRV